MAISSSPHLNHVHQNDLQYICFFTFILDREELNKREIERRNIIVSLFIFKIKKSITFVALFSWNLPCGRGGGVREENLHGSSVVLASRKRRHTGPLRGVDTKPRQTFILGSSIIMVGRMGNSLIITVSTILVKCSLLTYNIFRFTPQATSNTTTLNLLLPSNATWECL